MRQRKTLAEMRRKPAGGSLDLPPRPCFKLPDSMISGVSAAMSRTARERLWKRLSRWPAALGLMALAAACGYGEPIYPDTRQEGDQGPVYGERASVFGEGGLTFGGDDAQKQQQDAGIGVNSFLWRASLDTISFMPLVSADPFGGVIITDWYSDPTTPNERFKATVYILDTRLRADALNVSIFKQTQQNGQWVDATVDPDTEIQIENAILTRARQLRLSNVR